MSKGQRAFLAIGLFLMAASAFFPPRVYFGPEDGFSARGYLYKREFTGKPCGIDLEKLTVEWMFLAATTGTLMVIARNRTDGTEESDRNVKIS